VDKEILRSEILPWSTENNDARAVVKTGAGVRRNYPADDFSDLDIELYFQDYAPYAAHSDWFEAFGEVWVYLPLFVDGNFPSRLVIYEGGAKVDFLLYDVADLKRRAQWQMLPDVYQRGFKIHLDKDDIATHILPSPFAAPTPKIPSVDEFNFVVREFWFEAFHVAKYLRRGDLWPAKFRDRALQDNLLRLMEWHAQTVRDENEIWFQGRFLKEWTDAETYATLPTVFAGYDSAASWQALHNMAALFRRLSKEVAQVLGFDYPEKLDENMSRFIDSLFNRRDNN